MKALYKQVIEKKLEIADFNNLRKQYSRYVWNFYQIFSLCVAVLGIKLNKKDIRIRNRLYGELLLKGRTNEKIFEKMKKLMSKDFDIINKTIKYIAEDDSLSFTYGSYYEPGFVAIDIDEFPID